MHTITEPKTPIVHLTTVHPRHDTRIRVKQAATLARAFGAVMLVVADGEGDEAASGVRIVDLGRPGGGRVRRALTGSWRAFRKLRELKPASVHFHDPELLPLGLLLRLLGSKVIYDVHEDVPRQIMSKLYLRPAVRRPVALAVEAIEWLAGRSFSAIVAATPAIARRFPAARTVTVQNFPILNELVSSSPAPYAQRPSHFIYVGGLTAIRGAAEMIAAIHDVPAPDARLRIVGKFQQQAVEDCARSAPGWQRTEFLGWAGRNEVADMLARARAGLVLFHPVPNHLDAQPNKLFEYMAAGLPVIASDFPLWRTIVAGAGCGLLVDPIDPKAIAAAMDWLLANPDEAETMGRRGRLAVEEKYNWGPEGEKLVSLYAKLGISPTLGTGPEIPA